MSKVVAKLCHFLAKLDFKYNAKYTNSCSSRNFIKFQVRDLDLVKQVMVKDFDHFVDHRPFVDTDPLFSKSLFFLNGQEWKDMRTVLSPTFTSGKIKRMFHHFVESGEKLMSKQ